MQMFIFSGFALVIGYIVVMILVIVNIINNPEINSNNKLFWIILILLFNFIGMIVYLLVEDKNVLKWSNLKGYVNWHNLF